MPLPLACWDTPALTLIPNIAIALAKFGPATHSGILFRTESGIELLHFADHFKVVLELPRAEYVWAIPNLLYDDAFQIARLCARIGKLREQVPYGFAFSELTLFDPQTGAISVAAGTAGVTCATFVLAVFNTFRIAILVLEPWELRADDIHARESYIDHLRANPRLQDLVEKLTQDQEIKSWRYRPEEVVGASSAPQLPVAFAQASKFGENALNELRTYYERVGIAHS